MSQYLAKDTNWHKALSKKQISRYVQSDQSPMGSLWVVKGLTFNLAENLNSDQNVKMHMLV